MKNVLVILSLLLPIVSALGQHDDDTLDFVQGLPETGEEADVPPVSPDEVNDDSKIEVPTAQIPSAIRETLKDTAIFGQEQRVLYDRKIKLYRVEVERANVMRFYTMDEDGKITSVQEKNILSDPKK